MKKLIFIALIISGCFSSTAQRSYVYGIVKDSLTKEDLIGVHIQNIDAGSLTSTNAEGKFQMPGQIGDTIVFSSVGHKTLAWIVDSTWFKSEEIEFLLPVNTIYLDEVVVGEFPEYERFKDLVIKEQPKDTTFVIFRVPRVVMDPYPQMEKSEYLNPVFVFFHPISAIHHSVSKKEKEKRKMQQIRRTKYTTDKARLKFTREWVSENTKLEGDKLTSFISYCNFSDEYLATSSEFAIYELMMDLLPKFLDEYEEG
ncbi:carboxypeptidase-like regulatory domain-containing protein [Ekhidna sp.]|uniref:carboxypeptidase-like regulatory domain-containing protein n=1 Tax=Ekhidna sp. TaxID=2608089 RepID=UPI00329976BA